MTHSLDGPSDAAWLSAGRDSARLASEPAPGLRSSTATWSERRLASTSPVSSAVMVWPAPTVHPSTTILAGTPIGSWARARSR